jgi:hypothetical protein
LLLFHGHVGERAQAFRHHQRDVPRGLPVRFVEAGKRAPRVHRLELGERVPAIAFLLAEEADRAHVFERAGIRDRHLHFTGRQDAREAKPDHLFAARHHGAGDLLARRRERDGANGADVEPLGVEPHEVGGLEHAHRDVDRAGERFDGGVDPQLGLVEERHHVARQAHARNGRGARLRAGVSGERESEHRDQGAADCGDGHVVVRKRGRAKARPPMPHFT